MGSFRAEKKEIPVRPQIYFLLFCSLAAHTAISHEQRMLQPQQAAASVPKLVTRDEQLDKDAHWAEAAGQCLTSLAQGLPVVPRAAGHSVKSAADFFA
jgi:hypothetical protein